MVQCRWKLGTSEINMNNFDFFKNINNENKRKCIKNINNENKRNFINNIPKVPRRQRYSHHI